MIKIMFLDHIITVILCQNIKLLIDKDGIRSKLFSLRIY